MEYEDIKSKLQGMFNEVQEQKIEGRRNWSKIFFDVLKKVGIENGFKVYSSSTSEKIEDKEGGGEWLFDLCWSKEKPGKADWQEKYKGLKLICECEWNMSKDEFLHDFLKLAVGKAEIKMMIVQYNEIEEYEEMIKWAKDYTDDSLLNDGAIYVLVGSGNKENDKTVKWQDYNR